MMGQPRTCSNHRLKSIVGLTDRPPMGRLLAPRRAPTRAAVRCFDLYCPNVAQAFRSVTPIARTASATVSPPTTTV